MNFTKIYQFCSVCTFWLIAHFFIFTAALAAAEEDSRIEVLKFEAIKWANTLNVNSVECQYRFTFECFRDLCKERADIEDWYEESVLFRYQHPNQYVRIERIQPTEEHYTIQESAIYDGLIAKRFDFSGKYLGGFIKSPEISDAETFGAIMLPTEFFQTKNDKYLPLEKFFSSGVSHVYERNEFLVLSHQSDFERRSIDFFFDDKMQMRRMDFSVRTAFERDKYHPDPKIFYEEWGPDPLEARALFFTIEFNAFTESDGVLFPILINWKYYGIKDSDRANELRLLMKTTEDQHEQARALCEFFRLPKHIAQEYNITVEQISINPPLDKSDFQIEFPADVFVADWSNPQNRHLYYNPAQEINYFENFRVTPLAISAAAAFLSVVFAIFAVIIWIRKRSPTGS